MVVDSDMFVQIRTKRISGENPDSEIDFHDFLPINVVRVFSAALATWSKLSSMSTAFLT